MGASRLHRLAEYGQSVWIDFLSRDMLRNGELERRMRDDAVVGVTSNPTIFQKAISSGAAYDEQLREVLEEERDPKEIFLRLAIKDVEDALDLLRPVWDEGSGQDGYVSLEVDPNLASDTAGTIEEAQHLHETIDRPNLFVKIPATKAGLPAIEEMIAGGRWEALSSRGATTQRCLWASTSTKNPAYRDVMYVEELIGPKTVNTMPEETIEAFQDHG